MSDEPIRISAAQVSKILQRAAEIDASGDSLTEDELRRIAAEAGIDPEATRTAINEIMADKETAPAVVPVPVPTVPAKVSTVPRAGSLLMGGAVGTVLGLLASLADLESAPALGWLGFGATIFYLVTRALNSMKRGAQLDFQLQNLAIWFGAFVGILAPDSLWAEDWIPAVFLVWLLTSALGGLLVKFGPREEQDVGE